VVFGLLVVEDYIDGRLVGRVVKDWFSGGDLSTANYVRLVGAMFTSVPRDGSASFSAVDVDGVSRTFIFKVSAGSRHWFWNTYICANRVRVGFGSSTAVPARNNYRLGSEFISDESPRLIVDEDAGVIVVEGRFVDAVDRTVCEVGLFLHATVSFEDVCRDVLVDRTVWSPCRSVPAGVPYIVRYRFVL